MIGLESLKKTGGQVEFLSQAPATIVKHFRVNNTGAAFQADAIPLSLL